jgi:putative membrane protein
MMNRGSGGEFSPPRSATPGFKEADSMRILLSWLMNALAFLLLAWVARAIGILPGFHFTGLLPALLAVAILGLLNAVIRPILSLLSLPINFLSFGLFSLVINAFLLYLTAGLVPGFRVGGFWNALVVAFLYSLVSSFLNALFFTNKAGLK